MQRRVVLTRGEVANIVREHLREKGLHPEKGAENTHDYVTSMQVLDVPGIEMPATGTSWEDWPTMYFQWDEDAPADESLKPKVVPLNDEGM